MVREVVLEGNPILREKMPNVPRINGRVRQIIKDLEETMRATNAVGFAANQIGIRANVCIAYDNYWSADRKIVHLVNPLVIASRGVILSEEGCKSIPGYFARIPRASEIQVKCIDGIHTLKGYGAAIAQHEIDHLNGILIRDYVENANGKNSGVLIKL